MMRERFCNVPAEQLELLDPPEEPVGRPVPADAVPERVGEATPEGSTAVPSSEAEGKLEGSPAVPRIVAEDILVRIEGCEEATAMVEGNDEPAVSVTRVAVGTASTVVDKVTISVTVTGESVTVDISVGVLDAGAATAVSDAALESDGELVGVADAAAESDAEPVGRGDVAAVVEAGRAVLGPRSTVV